VDPFGSGGGAVGSSGEISVFARTEEIKGQHPSGAAICQRCGCAASLEAAHGPDWSRRRMTLTLLCEKCASMAVAEAERFRLTLTLRPWVSPTHV
jgi:hypothetical protein